MPEGHFAAESDEFSRMPKIEPTIVQNVGPQHDIGLAAGAFRRADLRAVDAAHAEMKPAGTLDPRVRLLLNAFGHERGNTFQMIAARVE